MTVPTSGAGTHLPYNPNQRSTAEKRTASGVEKPQVRAVPIPTSPATPTTSSSSSSSTTRLPSYQDTQREPQRLDSPMPPLIRRSQAHQVQEAESLTAAPIDRSIELKSSTPHRITAIKREPPPPPARPHTPPSLIPEQDIDGVDGLVNLSMRVERKNRGNENGSSSTHSISHPGSRVQPARVPPGPRMQGTFMQELARNMPFLQLPALEAATVAESKASGATSQRTASVIEASSSTSSSSSSSLPAPLEQLLAAVRDVSSLKGLEGEALTRESNARREVFSEWAASLPRATLPQAFREAGAAMRRPSGVGMPPPLTQMRLCLWEMMSLAEKMSPEQRQAEIQAHQDISALKEASHPYHMSVLIRARFIALFNSLDAPSRQAALEAASDVTPLPAMTPEERRLVLQIRGEQFKAHCFLGTHEQAVAELAQLRQPGLMHLMDNDLLACESELRRVQFEANLFYLSPSQRAAEVRKALDMSALRKINALAWERTLKLREVEFAAYTRSIGEDEGAEALQKALVPENLGTMLEAGQERTLLLRQKLVLALMKQASTDPQALARALATLKDPVQLGEMSPQRLLHALRLRKQAFAKWMEAHPVHQRTVLARTELEASFDIQVLTRMTIPLQASTGLLRLSLAEVAMRYL